MRPHLYKGVKGLVCRNRGAVHTQVTIAIATPQSGLDSLGMSFDNPSRRANPWATLKRTVKTKSLRFVCQFVSAPQKNLISCPNGHANVAIFVNSNIIDKLT